MKKAEVIKCCLYLSIGFICAWGMKQIGTPMVTHNMGIQDTINLKIMDNDVMIDFSQNPQDIDLPMLTTEFPIEIELAKGETRSIIFNGVELKAGSKTLVKIDKISHSDSIPLMVKDGAQEASIYYIPTISNKADEWNILKSDKVKDGVYYMGLGSYIYKVNTKGEILFYRNAGEGHNVADFKKTDVNGKVRYTYLVNVSNVYNPIMNGVAYFPKAAVVLDEHYNIIDWIEYMIPTENVPDKYSLECHDFMIIEDGHYIMTSYVGKRVYNIPDTIPHPQSGARVVASVIQEIVAGKLVWEWDSTDWPELYEISVEGNDYYNEALEWSDYAHLNSIDIDSQDGNLICSFRHLNSIIKLDRKTGEIIWILGGKKDQYHLNDKQKFSRQHCARITEEGELTIFDNGNKKPVLSYPSASDEQMEATEQTRILKLKLDEKEKKIEKYEEFEIEKAFSSTMGSVQKLQNEIYLIGWGGRSTPLPVFSEVDFSTNKVLFELLCKSQSYRVYKFED